MQRSLVLIKPDAVQKGVWLDIIKTYEQYGLNIGQTRIMSPMNRHEAIQIYDEHRGEIFYDELIAFMTKGITIALMIVGNNAIALVRAINGATKPHEAEEGTIRKKYGGSGPANSVHGSATTDYAQRELSLVFNNNPLCIECGFIMQPVGTCWKCSNCHATQGC